VHDAKRGDVVLQVFEDEALAGPERFGRDEAHRLLASRFPEGVSLAGSGAVLFEALGPVISAGPLDPVVMLTLTPLSPSSASPPAPFYARPPDAKLPGGVDPA
jgi:tRNA threonylcarbamoyladenosine biosynthesis protein TsaB